MVNMITLANGQNVMLEYTVTGESVEGRIGQIWNESDIQNVYVFIDFTGDPLTGEPMLWGPKKLELDFMKYLASHDVLNHIGIIKITNDTTNFKISPIIS